jgi:hypothetical protein
VVLVAKKVYISGPMTGPPEDIERLLQADEVWVLPGGTTSEESRRGLDIARSLGIPVVCWSRMPWSPARTASTAPPDTQGESDPHPADAKALKRNTDLLEALVAETYGLDDLVSRIQERSAAITDLLDSLMERRDPAGGRES